MKITKNKFLLFFLLLFAAQSVYASGGRRNGTAGAAQLLVPVGTRGIAMSGSVLSNSQGLDGVFYNPANLSRSEYATNVFFSHMTHIADIGVTYGAVSTNMEGFGSIAIGLKSFAIDEIAVTSADFPDGTGSTFTPQFVTIGATYSNRLSDRIAVGLTANYIYEKMALVSAAGVSFDIGISYSNLGNFDGLNFGIVIKNLGPQMTYSGTGLNVQANVPTFDRPSEYYTVVPASYELPSTLEMGVSYNYNINNQNSLVLASTFQNNNFDSDKYRFGAEYTFMKTFSLRGGYAYAPDLTEDENIFGFTAGAGLNYSLSGIGLKIDYAYQDLEVFDAQHIFSLSLGF